jgi:tetratricopeptide (TPR) repeat protein
MSKIFKFLLLFYLLVNISNVSIGNDDFYNQGLEFYKNKKYEDARFMFERSIVFNPKDSNSYLYLAKIYGHEDDQDKEEKNLETTLLIEPGNEEAILLLMKIALKKSNYSKVKDLSKNFIKVCTKLCNENKNILETLENIEPKNNES